MAAPAAHYVLVIVTESGPPGHDEGPSPVAESSHGPSQRGDPLSACWERRCPPTGRSRCPWQRGAWPVSCGSRTCPPRPPLECFDPDHETGIDASLLVELATCRRIDTGNTHLAVRLAACCHEAALEGRWSTTIRYFSGPTLLVIDEPGYLAPPAAAASALFQFLKQRYLNQLRDHHPLAHRRMRRADGR